MLIENGTNVNHQDKIGYSALILAAIGGNNKNWNITIDRKRNVSRLSYISGHEGIVKLLLDNGANINAVDLSGNTPLFAAINKGNQPTGENDYIYEIIMQKIPFVEGKNGFYGSN